MSRLSKVQPLSDIPSPELCFPAGFASPPLNAICECQYSTVQLWLMLSVTPQDRMTDFEYFPASKHEREKNEDGKVPYNQVDLNEATTGPTNSNTNAGTMQKHINKWCRLCGTGQLAVHAELYVRVPRVRSSMFEAFLKRPRVIIPPHTNFVSSRSRILRASSP